MTAPMTAPVGPDTVLRVRDLSVVAQGDDFLVGDPQRGSFVVLPEIGVRVIELLRAGRPVGDVAISATEHAGTDVDVADFAQSLCALGFAEIASGDQAAPQEPGGGGPRRPRWATLVNGPAPQALVVLAVLGCGAAFAASPALLPAADDVFFLSTPARSIVALMLITYGLRGAHEVCHWLAARAEGVPSRVSVARRLYLLVFETDLTGLWALPRRRRFWPLLIGMGFDAVVLAAVLAARLAADAGWWRPAPVVDGLLAALVLLQVAGIVSQFFVFLRSDVYAVFAAATGCFNLWRVTRLTLRHRLGLARAQHRAELDAAHPRDRAIARWFVWVYAAGMLLALWFFVFYFLPAVIHTVGWIGDSVLSADPRRGAFWEAAGFGAVLLSPYVLTAWVAGRDALRWLRRR
jgi:putative peptide zinc metalloprotease protein